MGARPEKIRSEIEETRDRITAEIDELTDRYSPGRVASRKASGARKAAVSMLARVGRRNRPRPESTPYPSDVARQGPADDERGDPRAPDGRGKRLMADRRATAASGSAYAAPGSPASYDADAVFPPTVAPRATTHDAARLTPIGAAERSPDNEASTMQRSDTKGGRHEDRGRGIGRGDVGLMGASILVGALGVRRVLRPGSGASATSAPQSAEGGA